MRRKGVHATVCKGCGAKLDAGRKGAWCRPCWNAHLRAVAQEERQSRKAAAAEAERLKKAASLVAVNEAARRAGLSYGKYVAGGEVAEC